MFGHVTKGSYKKKGRGSFLSNDSQVAQDKDDVAKNQGKLNLEMIAQGPFKLKR